jgi:hypothetical protein
MLVSFFAHGSITNRYDRKKLNVAVEEISTNINDGINELGRLVPNGSGEKAKGAILSRAVQYIHHLKGNEARNIEKWTLEKLLMDQQAMGDLQAQLEEVNVGGRKKPCCDFTIIFCSTKSFLQLDYIYVKCGGYDEYSSPKYQHLMNRGLETQTRLESQVSSFSFLLFYYFTNDLLQLDSIYVNCEGDDGHTPPIRTPG